MTTSDLPSLRSRGRLTLYVLIAICLAPILASYFTYYFVHPTQRSNYGDLIDPQRPTPMLALTSLDGASFDLHALSGKWIMLTVDGGECDEDCVKKLFAMRQIRIATGKERDRVERAWLITDQQPITTTLIRAYDGMYMLRTTSTNLVTWLPHDPGTQISDYIYLVDPHGNLMMRFPRKGDPLKVKRDLLHLLNASSIG